MRNQWILLSKLSPSWERLEKESASSSSLLYSSRDLTLLLLGLSSCLSKIRAPPSSSSSLAVLSELRGLSFTLVQVKMSELSPRELAACFWCMYTLGGGCMYTRSGGPGVTSMHAALNSALERIHQSVREFSHKEILLIAITLTRMDLKSKPLLLDVFRCMYTCLSTYDPEELAAAFFAFGRARVKERALEVSFLYYLHLALPLLPPDTLSQVTLAFYSLSRLSSSPSPVRQERENGRDLTRTSSSSSSSSESFYLQEKYERFRERLLYYVLLRRDEMSARSLGGILMCIDALHPSMQELKLLLQGVLQEGDREDQDRDLRRDTEKEKAQDLSLLACAPVKARRQETQMKEEVFSSGEDRKDTRKDKKEEEEIERWERKKRSTIEDEDGGDETRKEEEEKRRRRRLEKKERMKRRQLKKSILSELSAVELVCILQNISRSLPFYCEEKTLEIFIRELLFHIRKKMSDLN
ncbi:hypothetical protein CSUI_010292, partial [Cystoisospora suis]